MPLSKNIKQFRKDNDIPQETVAEKLHMSQPTYWRLENSDAGCIRRLKQIADALETTPTILENYHLVQNEPGDSKPADWVKELLEKQEKTIQQQKESLKFQNIYLSYIHTVWKVSGMAFGKPPTFSDNIE